MELSARKTLRSRVLPGTTLALCATFELVAIGGQAPGGTSNSESPERRCWRALAKDGIDLPPDRAIEGPSEVQMGNGETYDFGFGPSTSGDLRLDITAGNGTLLASMPIHVR